MNEYLARNEISAVNRAGTRAPMPVTGAQSATNGGSAASDRMARAPGPAPRSEGADLDEDIVSVAEYASVHARIADILASMRSDGSMTVDGAAGAIQSMIPAPIILVPPPPASKEAVEHAAQLAKKIAAQASLAHAAQAHLKRGAVDRLLLPGG